MAIDSLWEIWNNEQDHDTLRLKALKSIILKKKYYANDLDTSLLLAEHIVQLARQKNIKTWEAEGHRLKGLSYYYHSRHQNTIDQYKKVLKIKEDLKIKKGVGPTLYTIAVAYRLSGDLAQALEYSFKSLEVRKENKNAKGIALSLQGIATVYYVQKKYEDALKYATESFELSQSIGYDVGTANAAVSIANSYSDMDQYEKSLSYYNEALVLYEKLGHRNQATCLDNIGNVYLKEKNYKSALDYQKRAHALRIEQNNETGLATSNINLGITYFQMNQNNKSLEYCLKGLDYASKTENLNLILNACECLYQTYEAIGDIKNAYKYYQNYTVAKDSLDGLEKTKSIEEIESKYELKEKEAVITERERDIAREQTKQSNTIIISLLIVGLLSILFAGLRSRLLKRRREAEMTAEKEHIEAEKLREMDRIKSSFFTNISHEIRTPLTLIMSPLEQILNGTLKGDLLKYQQIMYRNGQRLQALINQLLDLSKLESGHLQLNLHEEDLSQYLKTIAYSFNSLADRKQIIYSIEPIADNILAYFDKDVLEKILMNLISNAFKFTPEEGTIHIRFVYAENKLTVAVKDSGIGIPEDQVDTIFNRFYSSSSESELQMSSGIGLALTKELVELCEGEIHVESEVKIGSTFTVIIPILEVKKVSESELISEESINLKDKEVGLLNSNNTDAGSADMPHVLIVEDNEDVRLYLADQLRDLYKISEAENGNDGLTQAKKILPDLIISDIMMPKMDGNEMCQLLKTDPLTSHIPIILLTAKGEQKDRIEGLETGADAYLTKPFDQAELQIRIHNLVEQRRLLRTKFSSDFKFTPSEVTLTSIDAQFLNNVKSVIEASLEDETFSVEELSKEIGMSRSNLFRKLKALTDQSPNQVIREMRLIRAKELLEKRAGNSAEVAYMVGFNSPTYFSKCFNDYFGVSPTQV